MHHASLPLQALPPSWYLRSLQLASHIRDNHQGLPGTRGWKKWGRPLPHLMLILSLRAHFTLSLNPHLLGGKTAEEGALGPPSCWA